MTFKRNISEILLNFIKQNADFDFFIDRIIEWIETQKETGEIEWYNSIVDEQNRLFLKIVHAYSITIFETFNHDFFNEINKIKKLSKNHVTTTPSKILDFFQFNFKINLEAEFKLWNRLKEYICRRNVITHNMGRIDKKYQDCVGSNLINLDKIIGSDIPHDINYVKTANHTIANYIIFTFKKITKYYNLTNINSIVKTLAEHPYFADVNPNLLSDEGYIVRYKVELVDKDPN